MDLVFLLIIIALGTAIAFATKAKKWVLIFTIWLSVPLSSILSIRVGWYVAKLGDCHPSARAPIECVVHGYDVSDWINGLVFSGYAAAFVILPWFVIGAVCVGSYSIFRAIKTWKV